MKTYGLGFKKGRRAFFKNAILMGAAVFAGAGGQRVKAGADGAPASRRSQGGYRLTAHIRRYYERASF